MPRLHRVQSVWNVADPAIVKAESFEALARAIATQLELEKMKAATIWVYKCGSGAVYCSKAPVEGSRILKFSSREAGSG